MTDTGVFAGGCFWCIQETFSTLPGVLSAQAGFCGPADPHPSYVSVQSGETQCTEAVRVVFDAEATSFAALCDAFFACIDPTDNDGQFCDRGLVYRTAIYYQTDTQRSQAELARLRAAVSGRFDRPIVTAVRPLVGFTPAEEYHQNYAKRCPVNYRVYSEASGRPEFIAHALGSAFQPASIDPPEEELREKLSREAYRVAVLGGTERPTQENGALPPEEGLYVDVLSGAPLFYTCDQFDAGCGWPSFTAPVDEAAVLRLSDTSMNMSRIEIVARSSSAHLGHVFPDGPEPTGERFCINRAALRFIPQGEMAAHGYIHLLRPDDPAT